MAFLDKIKATALGLGKEFWPVAKKLAAEQLVEHREAIVKLAEEGFDKLAAEIDLGGFDRLVEPALRKQVAPLVNRLIDSFVAAAALGLTPSGAPASASPTSGFKF